MDLEVSGDSQAEGSSRENDWRDKEDWDDDRPATSDTSKTQGPNTSQVICIGVVGLLAFLGVILVFQARAPPSRRVAVKRVHHIMGDDEHEPRDRGIGQGSADPPADESGSFGGGGSEGGSGNPYVTKKKRPNGAPITSGRNVNKGRQGNNYVGEEETHAPETEPVPAAIPQDLKPSNRGPQKEDERPHGSVHSTAGINSITRLSSLPTISIGSKPLICITGNNAKLPLLPPDGTCDFAIFGDVIFGDGEWVSANSRGKLDNFLQEAGKSTMTIYMLSFPSKMKKEMISFLSSNAATDLINNYAARNIRGYGFARVDTSAAALENDTADFAEVLRLLNTAMNSAASGVSFIGLLIRSSKGFKINNIQLPAEIIKNVNLYIAISHTFVIASDGCKVEPISSWTHDHINDARLPSLSSTLAAVKETKSENTTFALSLSLGVLDFQVASSSLAGIDGIWNIDCTHCALDSFDQACRNPLTLGKVGTEDFIAYDYSKKTKTWRSYETTASINSKLRSIFRTLEGSGVTKMGIALFDVDMEDYHDVCSKTNTEITGNRVVYTKNILKELGTNHAPGR